VGLRFSRDLAAWQRWQAAHQPLPRRVRALVRRPEPPALALRVEGGLEGGAPRVLVALDSRSPTSQLALSAPIAHLTGGAVVLERAPGRAADPAATPLGGPEVADHALLDGVRAVVALGHYMEVGAAAHRFAVRRGLPFVVAQHGLVTPLAPPLPPDARLLAWSGADAAFWAAGRPDVETAVVGSQLLWAAAEQRRPELEGRFGGPPVYLGQLHGAELPRRDLARAARAFCLAHDATYRPHPSERDRISRLIHARWRRAGMRVDTSGLGLAELAAPVVSVFSTGVLESAARGLPAWVDFPDPPAWLREFWQRYDMRPFGGEPTPAPAAAPDEPARAVARHLEDL